MRDEDQIMNETESNDLPARQGASGSLNHLYRDWFLDYASYVILDRAIPALDDGLKPVQRRILHAMSELEDGRYNKAANVIGHTMRYHPHGDMAISDAMVRLAQKELLIDTQGNWGNPVTGDRAAAPRYIEGRLSEFAKEIVFNPETTEWQPSYDGRNKEPVMLPVKFPLLLAQGVEGIAVGLSTKILPHNFCELLRESVAILKGFKPQLFPDFHSGGVADFSDYKDGRKGGKIKVRAKIESPDTKTLAIRETPYGVTTSGLIDSILAAHEKGQIKIKKVVDNTSQDVEIIVHLPAGSNHDKVKAALFAFTDCEVSISPNCCVIYDGKPKFISVSEMLEYSTKRTKALLYQELKISRDKVKEKIFFGLLEHFFIQEKIYRKIENCESWEDILKKLAKAVKPMQDQLHRPIERSDLEKLTEIKIKRISKFDQDQATKTLRKLKKELSAINKNIKNITEYCIDYFQDLLKKYGQNFARRTRITSFTKVNVSKLVSADQKVYINYKEGFIGTSLKKDDFLFECTRLDEIIAFCQDGSFQVSKISDKTFYGKNIVFAQVFRKGSENLIWNALYRDGKNGPVLAKKFQLLTATKDKQYFLSKDHKNTKLLYISNADISESEEVSIKLRKKDGVKESDLTLDFGGIGLKTRSAKGVQITAASVTSVSLTKKSKLTKAVTNQRLWYDRNTQSLNVESVGHYLGKLSSEKDLLIAVRLNGSYIVASPDLGLKLPADVSQVEKLKDHMVISTIYYDGESKQTYVLRTHLDDLSVGQHKYVKKAPGSKIRLATLTTLSEQEVKKRSKAKDCPQQEKIPLEEFFDPKTLKAIEKKFGQG